ncbi:MAG: hypothetical protein ABI140_08565 [Jatrophihabitantaceae bacterium]
MSKDQHTSTESESATAGTSTSEQANPADKSSRPMPGRPVFSGPATPTQAVRANGRPVTQLFSQPDRPAPQQPAADLPLGEDRDRNRD